MNMQLSTKTFASPAEPAPTLFDLENNVCDVANFGTVARDYIEAILVKMRAAGHLKPREVDAACKMLNAVSDSAEDLLEQYQLALKADFAAKKVRAAQ